MLGTLGVMAKGFGVSFCGDENVLKWTVVVDAEPWKCIRRH